MVEGESVCTKLTLYSTLTMKSLLFLLLLPLTVALPGRAIAQPSIIDPVTPEAAAKGVDLQRLAIAPPSSEAIAPMPKPSVAPEAALDSQEASPSLLKDEWDDWDEPFDDDWVEQRDHDRGNSRSRDRDQRQYDDSNFNGIDDRRDRNDRNDHDYRQDTRNPQRDVWTDRRDDDWDRDHRRDDDWNRQRGDDHDYDQGDRRIYRLNTSDTLFQFLFRLFN